MRHLRRGAPISDMCGRYFNREISWLEFNRRVLEEAISDRHPLLERVKFLSIVHSNLDEFFMIRVSGLQEQVESGLTEPSKDGMTPGEQLTAIRERASVLRGDAWVCWRDQLTPLLAEEGIRVVRWTDLDARRREALGEYFATVVYPVLTPLAVDPVHPFPHISNLSINLAVVIGAGGAEQRFARVKVPPVVPRLVPLGPLASQGARRRKRREYAFVWLEDVIAANLSSLFRGLRVVGSYAFRVIRDADIEIREDEAGDLLQSIEQGLMRRRFGSVTQLELSSDTPPHIVALLTGHLQMDPADVYRSDGTLGLSDVLSLTSLDRPDLKDRPFRPRVSETLQTHRDIWSTIRHGDVLLHHPYDSFGPVVDMVRAAAQDPDVLALKQTIYRVGSNSPIVAALKDASDKGKQVSVVVELKARFDEENNIEWARALESSGVHVVYGDVELKTHCKLLMVVRRDPDGIRRYVHLGTGNYNARTALLYTDFGLFTCDPVIADDVSALFNALTGYSADQTYRKLLVSPDGIRRGLMDRLEREMEHAKSGRGGRVVFKMNSFTDFGCADAVCAASQAGVDVDLIVRGSCCVVPSVPGMSERVHVRSIVGRFLEHDRAYYFQNGGNEEVWLGSADLMPRNLDRRVETLFPVESEPLKRWLVDVFLPTYLRDTSQARVLHPDGHYERCAPAPGESACDAQSFFFQDASR